jgi:hypothetical protein
LAKVLAGVSERDCDCALRSFWDGPCEYHLAEHLTTKSAPKKFTDYGTVVQIELNKYFDPIIEQCAAELGWAAGRSVKADLP